MVEYMLENERLRVKLLAKGAELAGVEDKQNGRQCIWQATPPGWPRHAPLLFPYCGKLYDNTLLVDEENYPAGQHGFVRDMEFTGEEKGGALVFTLRANEATRSLFPFEFVLEVTYTLDGNKLRQAVRVTNSAGQGETLPFSLGFHPGFALPLEPGGHTADYELAFDREESPRVIETPGGYVSGGTHTLFKNRAAIPLTDDLFANDSICMAGLHSKAITLRPRGEDGGKNRPYVKVDIADFPYLLIWGQPEGPLPFVCIEPWHSLPDGPERYDDFREKPDLFLLLPGQSYETSLCMEFGPE